MGLDTAIRIVVPTNAEDLKRSADVPSRGPPHLIVAFDQAI